jgi:hypothetical protein
MSRENVEVVGRAITALNERDIIEAYLEPARPTLAFSIGP